MRISLSELILLINEKKNELIDAFKEVDKASIIMKDKNLDGSEIVLSEVKDFKKAFDNYEKVVNEFVEYKNALANVNSITKINSTLTIIEAINTLSSLRIKLEHLKHLSSKKPSITREFDGNGGSSYYSVSELNFEIKEILDKKQSLQRTITKIESDLAIANATNYVDLNL